MSEENKNPKDEFYFVSQKEPEAKAPPRSETGIFKWMRENLFSSSMNTILTIIGVLITVYSIVGLFSWAIQDANWYAVTYNLRFYLLGRYDAQYEWRIQAVWLFSIFVMGSAMAVWVKQIARTMLITTAVIVLIALLLPAIVVQTLDLPSFYMTVGNTAISQGTATETPLSQLAFMGEAGDVIEIRIAEDVSQSEESLAQMAGFIDRAANLLRNAAANRLTAIERHENLEAELARHNNSEVPILTAKQVETFTAEIEAFSEASPMTTEAYNLNQAAVRITVLDAATMQPILEATELNSGEVLEFELPSRGWYIIEREYLGETGLTVLETVGISPVLQSSSFSSASGSFVDSFVRLTDGLRIQTPRPEIDGTEIPIVVITDNKYLGDRSLGDYLRAYLTPFLRLIGFDLLWILIVGIAGYMATILLQWNQGKSTASNFAGILLASLPIAFWILVNGLYLMSVFTWLMVLSLILFSLLSFQIGKTYGNSALTYAVPIGLYLAYVLVLLFTNEFALPNFLDNPPLWLRTFFEQLDLLRHLRIYPLLIDPAAVPRFILWLGILPLMIGAYLGTGAHIIGDETKINWLAYGLGGAFLLIVGATPLLYGMVTLDTDWALDPSSSNNWGGLLLAMAITIYGIIIAFPIGIGLALGRRSDLPLVKALCIGFIELVRGSPFITVLFFMQLLLPLLNPELAQLSNTYRAIIATIAFSAAYLAENVRGGLQSLPTGQGEAAKALGLSSFQATMLITLPQALRAVIPALVGQFISLFKDTSLVSIVGLTDLVRAVDSVNSQAEFNSTRLEGLLFISIIYFVFSYVMSYVSRVLEASGSGATRRM